MKQGDPLAGYLLRARIDWVELIVEFPTPSQFRHVLRRMPPHWSPGKVKPLEGQASSRSFRFRVQDPDPLTLLDEIKNLAPNPALFDPRSTRVVAIEIALDVVPKSGAQQRSLAQVAAYMLRHHARPPAGIPRITRRKEVTQEARPRDFIAAFNDQASVNAGAMRSSYRARYYVKRHDTINGKRYLPLPIERHCARMEITLSDDQCPICTVSELQTFKYESLATQLAFIKDDTPVSPFHALLLEQLVQRGKPNDSALQKGHRRTTHLGTRRDTKLNQRVADALRALTRWTRRAGIHEEKCDLMQPGFEGNTNDASPSPKYCIT